jgi:hypothetical protein
VPEAPKPLNAENHPLSDGKFRSAAKWTGNGSKKIKPDKNDWYETVKVNYGVQTVQKIFRSFLLAMI